ncbi:hypothetical protein NP493_315g02016 [Ridgeia piscesae]|uniref:Uncharacterized protein n=1 Tax=Ridgeia piscesae TaxID=27915 RepID=A0AAD9NW02_RIDPI|nr:hypothetical protein NP493_315g02016 [Ridgeia piscesae]
MLHSMRSCSTSLRCWATAPDMTWRGGDRTDGRGGDTTPTRRLQLRHLLNRSNKRAASDPANRRDTSLARSLARAVTHPPTTRWCCDQPP